MRRNASAQSGANPAPEESDTKVAVQPAHNTEWQFHRNRDFGGIVDKGEQRVVEVSGEGDVLDTLRKPVVFVGKGHSTNGNSLASAGSQRMMRKAPNASPVRFVNGSDGEVWIDAAATVGQVAKYLHESGKGLILPVHVSTPTATIGGVLSVGGIGHSSKKYGMLCDHVVAGKIITPTGGTITAVRGSDVLRAALTGTGCFGYIMSAKVKLVKEPPCAHFQSLEFDTPRDIWPALADAMARGKSDRLFGVAKYGGNMNYVSVVGAKDCPLDDSSDASIPASELPLASSHQGPSEIRQGEYAALINEWDNVRYYNAQPYHVWVDFLFADLTSAQAFGIAITSHYSPAKLPRAGLDMMYVVVTRRDPGDAAPYLSPTVFSSRDSPFAYMVGAYFSPLNDSGKGVDDAKEAASRLSALALRLSGKPYWHSWNAVDRTKASFRAIYGDAVVDTMQQISERLDRRGVLNREWCAPHRAA